MFQRLPFDLLQHGSNGSVHVMGHFDAVDLEGPGLQVDLSNMAIFLDGQDDMDFNHSAQNLTNLPQVFFGKLLNGGGDFDLSAGVIDFHNETLLEEWEHESQLEIKLSGVANIGAQIVVRRLSTVNRY